MPDLQPVRVRVHGQLGREDGREEEVRDLQRPPELGLRALLVGQAVCVLRLDQIGDEVLPRTRGRQLSQLSQLRRVQRDCICLEWARWSGIL